MVYELQKYGINVSKPFSDNSPYDLVIDVNKKLYRVQIKSSAYHQNGAVVFRLAKTRYNRTSARLAKYSKEEVDYYALYSILRDKIYILPFEDAPKSEVKIRYEPCMQNAPTIRYEDDYTIEKIFGIKQLPINFQKNKRLH